MCSCYRCEGQWHDNTPQYIADEFFRSVQMSLYYKFGYKASMYLEDDPDVRHARFAISSLGQRCKELGERIRKEGDSEIRAVLVDLLRMYQEEISELRLIPHAI